MADAPALHPWNRAFSWRSPAPPYRRLTDDEAAQFDRDGYLVFGDLLTADEVAEVVHDLDAADARVDELLATQPDERLMIAERGAITFAPHVVVTSEVARRLSRHPAIIDLCHDLVGPDVRLYWDQAVYKKREKPRRFPWHQDNGYTFVEPQQYLTVWIALTDATIDNGCPWVAPGRHRLGTLEHRWVDPLGWECLTDVPDAVPAEAAAGGAVVFSSLTPHLTGPNTTDAVRKAYILQYAPDGATILQGAAGGDEPSAASAAADPSRQYLVLRDGEAVTTGG